jgi:hypothetical protein
MRIFLLASGLTFALGCGSKAELHSAHGKVYVDGKPADGAIVVLHPAKDIEAKQEHPSATVDADGSFHLEAPAGEYQVAVVWYDPSSKTNPKTGVTPTKLNPRFSDPKTSALRAAISPGENELPPFQLGR